MIVNQREIFQISEKINDVYSHLHDGELSYAKQVRSIIKTYLKSKQPLNKEVEHEQAKKHVCTIGYTIAHGFVCADCGKYLPPVG